MALLAQQPGITVPVCAASAEELAPLIGERKQVAVLVDAPGGEPVVAQALGSTLPHGNPLCLVDAYELESVVPLLKVGAIGCLARDSDVAELARAVIAASRRELVLPPELAAEALRALAGGGIDKTSRPPALTEREQEVLGLLAQGLTNKDIAQALVLSVRTVEAHLRNIYGKLEVGSRTEAVLWAVQRGYGPAI